MRTKIVLLSIFISFIFSACEDVVEVELSDEVANFYAVQGKITTENNPYVYLYKSQRVDEDHPYVGVSGATVTISDNSQPSRAVILTESDQLQGLYILRDGTWYLGKPGKQYFVNIKVNGVELNASDFLAPVEPIDSIQVHSSLRGDHRFLGVFTFGNEPVGQGNFYKWDIYINEKLLNSTSYLVIASDELVDGNYINGFEIFTDFYEPGNLEDRIMNLGDTIKVKQTSTSEFAYYFYYQMFNQSQTGGLFSVPPANVKGNFTSSDGKEVLGLFTAHDVSTSNSIIIDQAIEDQIRD